MSKDHAASNGLQHTSHCYLNRRAHIWAPAFNHNHRPVIQVSHTLAQFFPFLDDLDLHIFPWQKHWFDSIRQFVNIEDLDTLQFRNTVEVIIVSDNRTMQHLSQLDKFPIDLCDPIYFGINNLDRNCGVFLQAVEHIQPTSATIATHRVSRIGDTLQFVKDKARYYQCSRDETRLTNISDASVDDRTGI